MDRAPRRRAVGVRPGPTGSGSAGCERFAAAAICPRASSAWSTRVTPSSSVWYSRSTTTSGASGASYTSRHLGNDRSSRRRPAIEALLVADEQVLDRRAHEHFEKLGAAASAASRASRCGAVAATSTTTPCCASRPARKPVRRTRVSRSSLEKPRPRPASAGRRGRRSLRRTRPVRAEPAAAPRRAPTFPRRRGRQPHNTPLRHRRPPPVRVALLVSLSIDKVNNRRSPSRSSTSRGTVQRARPVRRVAGRRAIAIEANVYFGQRGGAGR
jgi:hypothetical protein